MTSIFDGPLFEENGAARDFADSIQARDGALEEFQPHHGGRVAIWTRGSGHWDAEITRNPGLSAADQESFDRWARERIYLLIVSGTPELDGWSKRTDGGWQLVARDAG